jgi:hypothetical protein
MANALFTRGRTALLQAGINWQAGGDTFKIALVDTGAGGWAVDLDVNNMSFISPFFRGTPITVTGLAVVNGAADANDVTFPLVTAGSAIEALVIYKEVSGVDQTQNIPLVFIDTATGLPITPNGGDIIIVWDNGANRIFRP